MTPAQCRAARALLDWPQQELANAAGVGVVTVRKFESGVAAPRNATIEAMMNSFESAGVEFLAGNGGGPGVRLRHDPTSLEEFLAFLRLYERRRLSYLARQVGALPQFGYSFVYTGKTGANLMYQGVRLGEVRWHQDTILFDPPLPPETELALSDEIFNQWVSRAEYRKETGIS